MGEMCCCVPGGWESHPQPWPVGPPPRHRLLPCLSISAPGVWQRHFLHPAGPGHPRCPSGQEGEAGSSRHKWTAPLNRWWWAFAPALSG